MREVDDRYEPRPGEFETVHVDRINRFALEIDERTRRTFLSIPVSEPYVDYTSLRASSPSERRNASWITYCC